MAKSAFRPPAKDRADEPKQAVVIVHGMGEQAPMSTLRGFVDTVWTRDTSLRRIYRSDQPVDDEDGNQVWLTPDDATGSYEQRRFTTPYDVKDRRTDFFELYWADITQGNTLQRMWALVRSLIFRRRRDIPDDALKLHRALIAATIIVALALLLASSGWWFGFLPLWLALMVGLFAVAVMGAVRGFVLPYFGDVAAYVKAEAATVEKRAEVRKRGLALLRRLNDDPRYDRIVIVAHSLGSIIAYDLIQILWAQCRPDQIEVKRDRDIKAAIDAVAAYAILPDHLRDHRKSGSPLSSGPGYEEFRKRQWVLFSALKTPRHGRVWKFSDFVTLGSPLSHAEFLTTTNAEEWALRVAERSISLCPPLSEKPEKPEPGKAPKPRILYRSGRNKETKQVQHAVHHAAAFAATRWTNIYDKGNGWLTGDPFSGPLDENFGPGVENIRVKLVGSLGRVFTHTLYWDLPAEGEADDHIRALRDAVDLRRSLEP